MPRGSRVKARAPGALVSQSLDSSPEDGDERGWPRIRRESRSHCFLGIFQGFSTYAASRFCRLGEVPPSDRLAVLAGAKSFAGMARSCDKEPDLPRRPRKGELSTRTVIWPRPPARPQNNCSRGLLYIFSGAGTLRKNASAN